MSPKRHLYPLWLKLSIAFGAPFFTTLAATWHEHFGHTIVSAMAAGFGGLAGLTGNDFFKARSGRK